MASQNEIPDPECAAPLIRAVAVFREEIDRLIDEQKALVLAREVKTARVEAPEVPSPRRVVPPPAEPDPTADPRQRLDALARLLDQRRKPAANGTGGGDAR